MTDDIILEKAKHSIPCLLQVEQEHLSKSSYSRVVWLVVSDSPYIKQWVTDTYTSSNILADAPNKASTIISPREIITTTSQGTHTRAARNPSTADFAEAMIDWYLIGESDVVITSSRGYSYTYEYGTTAAMRTHRPLYDAGGTRKVPPIQCEKMTSFIHEETPIWDPVNKAWISSTT